MDPRWSVSYDKYSSKRLEKPEQLIPLKPGMPETKVRFSMAIASKTKDHGAITNILIIRLLRPYIVRDDSKPANNIV